MPLITDKFGKASVNSDVAIATTVKTTRSAGISVLEAIDLSKYAPDTPVFVVTYKKTTDPLTGVATITQLRSWKALVNVGANTLTNLTIQPGYADDIGNAVGDFIECIPTSAWENSLIDGILTSLNPDGTLKTSAVQAALGLVNNPSAGWTPLGVTQSGTIIHNGNRSYDVPFASSVAAILSPGMRLLFDKTVAGNGYMGGAFNGTNQYFTKVTATSTLSTVADNITMMCQFRFTSYQATAGFLMGRFDSGYANGIGVYIEPAGQVSITIRNGGTGNIRTLTSQQSLPLNKTTHVAVTWAAGTVTISFDGVSVPLSSTVGTGGTAPTTAGTGGDFSVGRPGASNQFYQSGYISNVAVFNTVLSAATIKQYATYKLTGAEANCIGAWSLDNTGVNQQAPGTNDLTAQGGVGYTAMSPHGQMGDGVQASKAIGIVMAINGSTATVQAPEGVTIPTTGGITIVSCATSGMPFGFIADEERWAVQTLLASDVNTSGTVAGTVYNPGSLSAYVSAGAWNVYGKLNCQITNTSATYDSFMALSTAAASITDSRFCERDYIGGLAGASFRLWAAEFAGQMTFSTATNIYPVIKVGAPFSQADFRGDIAGSSGLMYVKAIPAGI